MRAIAFNGDSAGGRIRTFVATKAPESESGAFDLSATPAESAGDRIRTCAGTKPCGPKPHPFDHSGTPA